MDADSRLTVQRARMDLELEEGTISGSIASRLKTAGKLMADARNYVMNQDQRDAERHAFARSSTYFLSYLGHIDFGTRLSEHIDAVSGLVTVTRVPIVVFASEWNGHITLRTLEVGCEKSIAPELLELARAQGIAAGNMLVPPARQMDTFPLEELFD